MHAFSWKKLLCFLGIAGTLLTAGAADKTIITGFGDKSIWALETSAQVDKTGNTLTVNGSNSQWNRFARTRINVLKPNTSYIAIFSYQSVGEVNLRNFFHLLLRPFDANNANSDLLQANYTPSKTSQTITLHFKTNEKTDYAFQIHAYGKLQAKISDFTLMENSKESSIVIPNQPENYTDDLGQLPTGAQEFEVERPRNANQTIVNAADFGVKEENADNIEALNKAIKHCADIGAAKLMLPQGNYRMTALTSLQFKALKDFEFDGNGSTLIFHRTKPKVINALVADCERVILRNFNMDWDWERDPLASLVKVVGINKDSVDFKLYEYDRFPRREDVKIAFLSAYDPVAEAIGVEGGINRWLGMSQAPMPKTEWVSDNILRIFISPDGFHKDDLFRLQHYYYNDNDGFHLNSNQHLTLEDINIYSCAGHAIKVDGHQQYWQLQRVTISPPKGVARRPISSTADHCHINRSNGFMKIENCEFSHGGDDCLNVHDISSFVTKSGPRSVRTFRRWLGVLPPVGEIGELRNGDYSPTGIKAPIKAIKEIDAQSGVWEISFDCDIPEPIKGESGFILFDRSYGSRNIIVRNSKFHRNRARGLLLLGNDITIENNQFYHNEMGAIKIETGYTFNSWSEGYGASNIVIRSNTFDTVNPVDSKNSNLARDIYIGVYLQTDPSMIRTNYPILRDILFENNTFRDTFGLTAFISSAQNVTFRNNTFINQTLRQKTLPYRNGFFITHASDIQIINNRFVKSPLNITEPLVTADVATTKNITVQGNYAVNP